MTTVYNLSLIIVLAPLAGAIIAGLFGRSVGRAGAHWAASIGVGISFVAGLLLLRYVVMETSGPIDLHVYTWLVSGGVHFEVGFLLDRLSALMITVVTFVSLMVHIYTIGYMADDEHNWPHDSLAGPYSYQRFFAYISLFTFSMLMLVMANNFMQLFFGWEAVGLVSYLLIGFWFTRDSAVYANLKAFLVNRVGDFGFVLGIAAVLMYFNSLDYAAVFSTATMHQSLMITIIPGHPWHVMTLIGILLFIGAMGKSAQVPLHVWLPDSMEGPTPISALIHAATMVTAGIFMVARMSPLYELAPTALSVILVIGGITALFMGILGVIQTDIKRVIAYSTLSQLGYMTVALGASAYAAGIFHLMTHAFFKALLFLGAGSVIIAMHHDQDMRNMGGLRKYMPITWITTLVGCLALAGVPGFAGFYSKDSIIEAVHASHLAGAGFAYVSVLAGVFVTALYTFRLYFLVFHGKERMDEHTREHLRESPAVVTVPLIMLAIPSVAAGFLFVGKLPFGDYFRHAIYVAPEHNVLAHLAEEYHGPWQMFLHGFAAPPFWFAFAGFATAWFFYMARPELPARLKAQFRWLYAILEHKYGFDEFNEWFFADGGRGVGRLLWRVGDVKLIDGLLVNGTARSVGWIAGAVRRVQSGYLYHYAFAMIVGLLVLFGIYVVR